MILNDILTHIVVKDIELGIYPDGTVVYNNEKILPNKGYTVVSVGSKKLSFKTYELIEKVGCGFSIYLGIEPQVLKKIPNFDDYLIAEDKIVYNLLTKEKVQHDGTVFFTEKKKEFSFNVEAVYQEVFSSEVLKKIETERFLSSLEQILFEPVSVFKDSKTGDLYTLEPFAKLEKNKFGKVILHCGSQTHFLKID